MVRSTMTGTVTSSGHGGIAAAITQNEQMAEEHSTLEQQPPGRLHHPAWCFVWRILVCEHHRTSVLSVFTSSRFDRIHAVGDVVNAVGAGVDRWMTVCRSRKSDCHQRTNAVESHDAEWHTEDRLCIDQEQNRPKNGPLWHAAEDRSRAGTAAAKTDVYCVRWWRYRTVYTPAPAGDTKTTLKSLQQDLVVHRIESSGQIQQCAAHKVHKRVIKLKKL